MPKQMTEIEIVDFHHANPISDPIRGGNRYELNGWHIWLCRRGWACAVLVKLQNSSRTDSVHQYCYHRYHTDLDKCFQFVAAVGTDPQNPLGVDLQRLSAATEEFKMEKSLSGD